MDLTATRTPDASADAIGAAEAASVRRADERALDDAVHGLAPRLLRFALGRSAHHDAPLAEEAAQDALAALVDRWRRHGAPDSPEAFAFSVLRRRLARAQVRRALSRPLEVLGEAFGASESVEDPEQHVGARDELRRVRAGLRRLSPKLREALLLVSTGGMDTRDAARVLGISASALKMRVSRARRELRQQLAEETRT